VKIFAVDVVDVVGRSRRREWVEERSLYIRTKSLATTLSRIHLRICSEQTVQTVLEDSLASHANVIC
jgi:hypothetical protein